MTREEAIETLGHVVPFATQNGEKIAEAIDMAIEALLADTVSREDTVTLNSPISIQAEMVSVVRCKDCQYRKKVGTSYYCELDEFNVKDADFCSWGERKEEVNGFKSVGQAWNTSQGRWEP